MNTNSDVQSSYGIIVNDSNINFPDREVTGEQILQKVNSSRSVNSYLFQKLTDGQLERVRFDDTIELSQSGQREFITVPAGQSYKFNLDGQEFEWPLPFISGRELKLLAGVDIIECNVWHKQGVGEDQIIENEQRTDLQENGGDEFFTGSKIITQGAETTFLPPKDRKYLQSKMIPYEELTDGLEKAIVIKGKQLPGNHLDINNADVLVLLPSSYPDSAPDMFYLYPWARVASNNKFPKATDVSFEFSGQTWQRWSRHVKEWRPGVDGIWTVLHRIDRSLEDADK